MNIRKKTAVELKIDNETELLSKNFKVAAKRLSCIQSVYPRDFNFGPLITMKATVRYMRPNDVELERHYLALCERLNVKNPESCPTPSERKLLRQLKDQSKKEICCAQWIGSHCIDLFIPNVRSNAKGSRQVMRGLAIEVDGDVHNYEAKMAKDERKGNELNWIGIGVGHIANWDFNERTVKAFKASYKKLPTLDSRERRRLWRRIYAFTLAIHLSDQQFFAIFREKPIQGGADVC